MSTSSTALLDVEGAVYRILVGWTGLVYAGILWVLGCIPVFTAPAASFALFAAARRIVDGDGGPSAGWFFGQMLDGARPATYAAVLMGAAGSAMGILLVAPLPAWLPVGLIALFAVPLTVVWLLTGVWVLPVLVERSGGALDAIRVAYLRAVRRPAHAVSALLAAAACALAPWVVPPSIALVVLLTSVGAAALMVTILAAFAAPASLSCDPIQRLTAHIAHRREA